MAKKKRRSIARGALITLSAAVAQMASARPAFAQTVSCIQPLVFGTVITCNAADKVTITPGGSRSPAGCVSFGGAPFSNGRCIVFGTFPAKAMQITIPASGVLNGGGDTMKVTAFNLVTNAGGRTVTITDFTADVPIGGTLNISSPQVSGVYTGSVTVTANFQ